MTGRVAQTAKRLMWFVGLWVAGVATVGIVGGIIKFWLGA